MDEKEITQTIEQAINGNWLPFGIVCACIGVIIILFIYILKMKEKQIKEDHDNLSHRTSKSFEKLTEISSEMKTMLAVHSIEIDQLKTN